jgi:serine/threonine protein kinase
MENATSSAELDATIDLDDLPQVTDAVLQRRELADPPNETAIAATAAASAASSQAQPRLPLAPGRVLCDRYVLTRIIHTGSVYTVFCARDLEAHHGPKFVALKTPRPDCADKPGAVEQLKQQFESARSLTHGGIVEVLEFGCDGDIWFMTLELLDGETLASVMKHRGALLIPHLARRVLRGLSDALAYAHAAGVAHGDLHPTNVFVLKGDRIKLTGFGAHSRAVTPSANRSYASPQVLTGQPPTTRDDLFSFACLAYEVLTGKHPFEQRSAAVAAAEGTRPEPPALDSERSLALMSALAFEPDARDQDIRALARTLVPDPQRTRAHTIEPVIAPPPPENDKRWWILAAASAVTMIGAVVLTRLS